MSAPNPNQSNIDTTINFSGLIQSYKTLQSNLQIQIRNLAASTGASANPSAFILLQFQMSQVTQVGESISNIISQVNSVINHAVAQQQPR